MSDNISRGADEIIGLMQDNDNLKDVSERLRADYLELVVNQGRSDDFNDLVNMIKTGDDAGEGLDLFVNDLDGDGVNEVTLREHDVYNLGLFTITDIEDHKIVATNKEMGDPSTIVAKNLALTAGRNPIGFAEQER